MKIIVISPHKKTDTIAQLIIEGLYENNIEVIASDSGNSVKSVYSDDEILKHSETADYIFAFWGKCIHNGVPEPKYYLLDRIAKFEKSVYIDGSEWTCTGFPNPNQVVDAVKDPRKVKGVPWLNEKMLNRCKWYFKRECFEEDNLVNGIIPLNVGGRLCMINDIDIEKKHDFFCSFGHLESGLRKPVYDRCVELKKNNEKIIIGSGYKFEDYLKMIKQSHMAVSAWGAGNSCRRMWEILSQGTCCFAQRKQILIPNNFIDGENIVYYSTIEEFNEKINYYLNNKEKAIQIGKNGREYLKKYHTSKMRVQYILNILNGKHWRHAL